MAAGEDDAYPSGRSGRPLALEAREAVDDGRRRSPSVARNKDVVRDAFLALAPDARRVLEIASGTGEHAVHAVAARADLEWTTSDPDPDARQSIAAWIAHAQSDQLRGPFEIDATSSKWPVEGAFDAVVAINMIHIAPIAACEGVFAGAARVSAAHGRVFFYGPFARDGRHTARSNADFDVSLKRRDPRWGVRDLDCDVLPIAAAHGFRLADVLEMPANNLSVVFARN